MTTPAENQENTGQNNQSEFEKIIEILLTKTPQEVADEFSEAKKDVDDIETALKDEVNKDAVDLNNFPSKIRVAKKAELKKISDVVKEIAVAISFPEKTKINIPSASKTLIKITNELVGRHGVNKINDENAVFIYKLINLGLEQKLETFDQLVDAFKSVKMLEDVDKFLYLQISGVFARRATELGISDPDKLNLLRTSEEKKKPDDLNRINTLDILLTEEKKIITKITTDISSLTLGSDGPELQEMANQQAESETGQTSGSDFEEAKRNFLEQYDDILKSELSHQIMSIYNPRRKRIPPGLSSDQIRKIIWDETMDDTKVNPSEIANNYDGFLQFIGDLHVNGKIPESEYIKLKITANRAKENATKILEIQGDIGETNIANDAMHYIQGWNEHQIEILEAMSNTLSFKEYIMKEYNSFQNPKEDWERFEENIRGLFDQVFSAANANPKDFWEKTFNELTEGMIYKELLMRIRRLGLELERDPIISNQIVKLKDTLGEPRDDGVTNVEEIGGLNLVRDKLIPRSLSKAISGALISQMIQYKEVTETLHNMTVISDLGLGFDKMAEYSGRVRMEDIVRTIKNIPGISEASQLYQINTQAILALNGHNLPVTFGMKNETRFDLDEAGWRAYLELKQLDKIKRLGYSDEKIANLVRMATSLSKGIFGGFWSTLMNSHNGFEFKIDLKRSKIEKGIIYYERVTTFKSPGDKGVDRMLPSIDFFLNAERFDLLRNYMALLYSYSPRDLNAKITKEDYWFRHEIITDLEKEVLDAMANGYSNELGEFDLTHVFMADTMRNNIIDMAERAGWRNVDYMRYLVYKLNPDGTVKTNKETGKDIVDFEATIKRLHGVGPAYIKSFIDDLFDSNKSYQEKISELSIENLGGGFIKTYKNELSSINKKWRIGKELDKKQKKFLRGFFYEKYIFEDLLKQFPSDAIIMEDRRWIPRDEAIYRKNMRDTLVDFILKRTYTEGLSGGDGEAFVVHNYLPLFVGAVQMMERVKWEKEFSKWEGKEASGDFRGDDVLGYTFKLTQQDVQENRDRLISFYKEFKAGIGEELRDGKNLRINDDYFLKDLPKFYDEMIKSINAERSTLSGGKGKKVTLAQRYADYLNKGMAHVSNYVSWGHLNIDLINFHSSGSRVTERFWGEVGVFAKECTPEISKVLMEGIVTLVSQKYDSDQAFEKAVNDILAPSFKKMSAAISQIDADVAYEHLSHFLIQLNNAVAKDRLKRIGVAGNMYDGLSRRLGKQSSYMTDNIPDNMREGATALTSAQVEIMTVVLAKAIGIRRDRKYPTGYEPAKFFGKEVHGFWAKFLPRKKIEDISKVSTEALVEAQGVDLKTKLKESTLNYPLILMLMVLALAKLAFDKDKKK